MRYEGCREYLWLQPVDTPSRKNDQGIRKGWVLIMQWIEVFLTALISGYFQQTHFDGR